MNKEDLKDKEDLVEEQTAKFPEGRGVFKKVFLISIGIIFIVLILSLSFYQWGGDQIIYGIIDSVVIDRYKIYEDNLTIEFEKEIYEEFIEKYKNSDGYEIKVCFFGEREENYIFINEIFYPQVFGQKYNEIIAARCPVGTLITLHTHPNRQCLPSEQDLKVYKELKKENKGLLAAILCEEGRFNFYK